MTETVQQMLVSFDALPDTDKHQVAVEIIRRIAPIRLGDLSQQALVGVADDPFRVLDAGEVKARPPIKASLLVLLRLLPRNWMLSGVAFIFESCGIWCLSYLWNSVSKAVSTENLLAFQDSSHQEIVLSMDYFLAWGSFCVAFVLLFFGRLFVPQKHWSARLLVIVTLALPVVWYVFLFFANKETVLSAYYLVCWGCFSMAFVFAVLGRLFATKHRWFSSILMLVSVGLPLVGYALLFYFVEMGSQ